MLDDVYLVVLDYQPPEFSPQLPEGFSTRTGTWQADTPDGDLDDIQILVEGGSTLHVRVQASMVPDLSIGQSIQIETEIIPFDTANTRAPVRASVSFRDPSSDELYAAYFVERPSPVNTEYLENQLTISPFRVERSVSCQGIELPVCNYQVELFDLRFSMGDTSVLVGQGEFAFVDTDGGRYRVENRQSLDTTGEAASKGTCSSGSGIRSFEIVRVP